MKFPGLKRLRHSRTAKVSMKIAAWGITRINRILPDTLKIHVFKHNRIAQIDEYLAHLENARQACAAQPDDPKCLETLSRALARLERWDEAAEALAKAIPADRPRLKSQEADAAAAPFLAAAEAHLVRNGWHEAAASQIRAIDRSDNQREALFLDLAAIHRKTGNPAAAHEAIRNAVIERSVATAAARLGSRSLETLRSRCYVVYHQTCAARQDLIVYETFHGKSVSCNPAAMLRAALDDPAFAGFTHVIVLDEAAKLPAWLEGRPDVLTVPRESNRYRRFLCEAGHLINNTTFPPYYIRRPFQKYLNTWHGTPMKTLGKFIEGKLGEHRNAQRNFLQASHILSQNAFTTEKLIVSHDIPDCFEGRFAETGYPRVDATVNAGASQKAELKAKLGIAPDRLVILYAPTWRGTLGSIETEAGKTIEALTTLAATHGGNAAILYRGHHLAGEGVETKQGQPWTEPDESVDTNDLLAICDILVSDYSSIIFDFLPLRRPIVLYAFDRDEYAKSRGYFIEPEHLGIPVCRTLAELGAAVNEARVGDETLAATYGGLEDGDSTRRAMDFFFRDDMSRAVRREATRPSILFFGGGLKKNGVTISLLARLNAIDHSKFEVILVTMTSSLTEDPEKVLHFKRVHPAVKIIDRGGKLSATPLDYLLNQRADQETELTEPMTALYQREARRILGPALALDVAIDYGGYSRLWAMLIGCCGAKRKLIYLHNDMIAERDMRFPELDSVFATYPLYDGFISVSASSADVNRRTLSDRAGGRPDAFVHVSNPVDYEAILNRAEHQAPAALAAKLPPARSSPAEDGSDLRFVNVARLSPEKGHKRLLHAFAKVRASHPRIRLYLVGDGPSREDLEKTAKRLRLGDSVVFLGQVDNPMPVIKLCDVFVFSSIHEGQGLALIEALLVGKTAISTDIPGPRDVLADGLGMLVPDSEDGLVQGMKDCIRGWKAPRSFDGEAYNIEAEAHFEHAIFGGSGNPGHHPGI